jgi:importin-9
MPRAAKDLGPFLMITTDDTLSLVLETLSVVLDVNKGIWLSSELANAIIVATLEVWTTHNKGFHPPCSPRQYP